MYNNYLNKKPRKTTTLIVIIIMLTTALHAQQFKSYYDFDIISKNTALDSISVILNKTKKASQTDNNKNLLVRCLITESAYSRFTLQYNDAFKRAGEALFLSEETKNTDLIAKSHEELGVLSYMFKQDDDAGFHFKKAHSFYKAALKDQKSDSLDLLKSHYNLTMYYQRTFNAELLKKHIDSCTILSKKLHCYKTYQIYLDEKKASIAEWQQNYHTAIGLLQNSEAKIKALKPEAFKIHENFLTILYARMASTYRKENKVELAKQYFEKALNSPDYFNEVTFYRAFINTQYADLLFSEGHIEKAYEKLKQASLINHQYLNPRNDNNAGFLTVRNQYQEQINAKNKQISTQKIQLAKSTQEALQTRILLFVVIFITIIIGLIIRSRIRLIKHQKVEKSSQELIDIKNKELTTNTLQLIEKDAIIKKLSTYLKNKDNDPSAKALIKSIENQSESLWDAFNKRFTAQNIGFYERLQEKVPNLSAADLKVCALIKLNFTGKEMAYLLGISLGSVHVARHRLRKKMKLDRDKNLTNFINSI
ncbi:helix-turn-helix transcriptional regulator [Pseudotamlana carrageenivorans]|uniref:HTH luxR-type domain-containing protein n=1 Tax=Pseudotamlana carrageenivorans TaxID=2069432 RepID=A0A2I7SHW6_9FLAO|nr:hypothetical protein [Tamlana carrageenivorans]AUS05493.1 hypothetical protein C1A40_08450 [Tamlana carrageenivorans]